MFASSSNGRSSDTRSVVPTGLSVVEGKMISMAAILIDSNPVRNRSHLRLVTETPAAVSRRPSRLPLLAGAVVLFLLLSALTVVAGRGGFADVAEAVSAVPPAQDSGRSVRIEPGDTVWSIARRIQPSGDVRPLVDRIITLNGGPDLVAGERLSIPD